MSELYKIEFVDGYIHIQHSDNFEITPKILEKLWDDLAQACQTYNCNKVLAEGPVKRRQISTADAFFSSEKAVTSIRGLKLACYFYNYKPDDISEFFKTVIQNRGGKAEFFTNKESALKWLGISKPD